jgi:hypothetical protein
MPFHTYKFRYTSSRRVNEHHPGLGAGYRVVHTRDRAW